MGLLAVDCSSLVMAGWAFDQFQQPLYFVVAMAGWHWKGFLTGGRRMLEVLLAVVAPMVMTVTFPLQMVILCVKKAQEMTLC